jgi:hypothetical protein
LDFEVVSGPTAVAVVAAGRSIRELPRLKKLYGDARWRKMKGTAVVRLTNGSVRTAEVHWYEAHGVGKREAKLKRILD